MHSLPTSDEIRRSIEPHSRRLSAEEKVQLEDVLRWDLLSEFDARFFSAHLRTLGIEFTPAFLEIEHEWARDEERHYRLFRTAYDTVIGLNEEFEAELANRSADFEPIAHLLEDEFSICCLGAYDELATVRAFRANIANYDKLGPEFGKVVRRVIADEARHYHGFLTVLQNEHAHRADEAEAALQRIRNTEGTAYGNTFVLDHDDPIFTDAIYDEAEAILLRHIRKGCRELVH